MKYLRSKTTEGFIDIPFDRGIKSKVKQPTDLGGLIQFYISLTWLKWQLLTIAFLNFFKLVIWWHRPKVVRLSKLKVIISLWLVISLPIVLSPKLQASNVPKEPLAPKHQSFNDTPELHIEPLKPLSKLKRVSSKSSIKTTTSPLRSSKGNTFFWGQCVWYVKNMRPEIPNSWSNANLWYSRAQAMGWPTGSTPKVGAVAWAKAYSHVALVEKIKGNQIYVSQMNVKGVGILSYGWYSSSNYLYIY